MIERERKRVPLSRTLLGRSLVNEKAKWRDESERPNRTERRRLESSYMRARFGSENDPIRVKIEMKSSSKILKMVHFKGITREDLQIP